MARNFLAAQSEYESVATAPVPSVALTLACWYRPRSPANSWLLTVAATATAIHEATIICNAYSIQAFQTDGSAFPNPSLDGAARPGAWVPIMGVFASNSSTTILVGGASATSTTAIAPGANFDSTYIGTGFQFGLGRINPADGDLAYPAAWRAALTAADAVAYAQGVDPLLIARASLLSAWDDFGRDRVGTNHMTTVLGRPVRTTVIRQAETGPHPARSYGARRVLRAS